MTNYIQFKYFLAVSAEKSFTKAAKKLYISQQSLSNHIHLIEKELGVKLFERSTPLKLTYAGRVFHEYALKISLLQDDLYAEINDINKKQKGEFRFGISYNRGALILPLLLPTLKKEFPYVEFFITEANYTQLQNRLVNGELDMIIEQMPFSESCIKSIEICEDKICLLISDDFLKARFSEKWEAVKQELYQTGRIALLAGCPFLLNRPGNSIRMKIENILISEGIEPESRIETENLETLLNLCSNNYGITFYPHLFFHPKGGIAVPENVNVIPLSYPNTSYTLGLGFRQEHYLSQISQRIIELITDIYSKEDATEAK